MAKDKNSFILYADLLLTISKLTDVKAGKLFKMILEYVNDKNPESDDILIQVAFEPIKQQLKRDLRDWEQKKEKRAEAGRVGGLKSGENRSKTKQNEANVPFLKHGEANEAVTGNGTVTVTVNDTVILSIERCGEIALADQRWIRANKVQDGELASFNKYLEQQGKYDMNPLDYKIYFAKLKGKYPELLKEVLSIEDLREMAKKMDQQ